MLLEHENSFLTSKEHRIDKLVTAECAQIYHFMKLNSKSLIRSV